MIPIDLGEAHAGGLGWELFAELGGVASWAEGEGFEDYAMFGVLPLVGAELGEDCGAGGCVVRRVAESSEDPGFEIGRNVRIGFGGHGGAAGKPTD